MWPTVAFGWLAVMLAVPIGSRTTRIAYHDTWQNLRVALGLEVVRLVLVTFAFAALVRVRARIPSPPTGRPWWGWYAGAAVLAGQWLHVAGSVALFGGAWPHVTRRVAADGLLGHSYVMGGIALVAAALWGPTLARGVRERRYDDWAEVIVHLAWCLIAASMAISSASWTFYVP